MLPFRLNPELLEFARRVECYVDDKIEKEFISKGWMGAVIKIYTKDGKIFDKRVNICPGHPENPLSIDEIVEKFKKCWLRSAKILSEYNLTQCIDSLMSLKTERDIGRLCNLITGE